MCWRPVLPLYRRSIIARRSAELSLRLRKLHRGRQGYNFQVRHERRKDKMELESEWVDGTDLSLLMSIGSSQLMLFDRALRHDDNCWSRGE